MTPSPDRAPPLWRRIRDALAADIAQGRWAPGERLPSETALAQRFGVNRHTLRRAIASLREDGTVHVRRGAGATVTQTTTDYPLGRRPRFTASLLAAGLRPGRTFLRRETARAARDEADALELAPGAPVHIAEKIGHADGVPVSVSRTCWPAEALPGFLDALGESGSVTRALAACGVADYTRRWTRLTAQRPGALLARQLQMPEANAVLRAESLSLAPAGRPVEYGLTWFCTDRMPVFVGDDPQAEPPHPDDR